MNSTNDLREWYSKITPSISTNFWQNTVFDEFFDPNKLTEINTLNFTKNALLKFIKDFYSNGNMIKLLHDMECYSDHIIQNTVTNALKQAIIEKNLDLDLANKKFYYFWSQPYLLEDLNTEPQHNEITTPSNPNTSEYNLVIKVKKDSDSIHSLYCDNLDKITKIKITIGNIVVLYEDIAKNFQVIKYKTPNGYPFQAIKLSDFPIFHHWMDETRIYIQSTEPLTNIFIISSINLNVRNIIYNSTFEYDPQPGRILIYGGGSYIEKFSPGYTAFHNGTMSQSLQQLFEEAHKESRRRRNLNLDS